MRGCYRSTNATIGNLCISGNIKRSEKQTKRFFSSLFRDLEFFSEHEIFLKIPTVMVLPKACPFLPTVK